MAKKDTDKARARRKKPAGKEAEVHGKLTDKEAEKVSGGFMPAGTGDHEPAWVREMREKYGWNQG